MRLYVAHFGPASKSGSRNQILCTGTVIFCCSFHSLFFLYISAAPRALGVLDAAVYQSLSAPDNENNLAYLVQDAKSPPNHRNMIQGMLCVGLLFIQFAARSQRPNIFPDRRSGSSQRMPAGHCRSGNPTPTADTGYRPLRSPRQCSR